MVRCGQDLLVDSVNDGTVQNREGVGEATLGINKRLWTASYIRTYICTSPKLSSVLTFPQHSTQCQFADVAAKQYSTSWVMRCLPHLYNVHKYEHTLL